MHKQIVARFGCQLGRFDDIELTYAKENDRTRD